MPSDLSPSSKQPRVAVYSGTFDPLTLGPADPRRMGAELPEWGSYYEAGPLVIDRGQGIHVWDTDGKQYIEGVAGLWCASLGFDTERLVQAATTQMR